MPDDELTIRQLEQLKRSDDPADRERSARLVAPIHEVLKSIKLPDFNFDFGERLRLQDEEMRRSMAEVHRAQVDREARRAHAEVATIESAQLLDSLVAFAEAQAARLSSMAVLLEALAAQAVAAEVSEERRWRAMRPVFVWTLVVGAIAALGAVGAIIATLASS